MLPRSQLAARHGNKFYYNAQLQHMPLWARPKLNTTPSSRPSVKAKLAPGDPFAIAAMRLAKLLEDASWDSAAAIRAELATYSPAMKLTFLTNIGSFVSLIAIFVSWAAGEDPLGGLTWSSASLNAALIGIIVSMPMAAISVLSRTSLIRDRIPVLADLHTTQAAMMRPLLQDLTPSQLLIAAGSTVLPALLLLLPAMHGIASMVEVLMTPDVIVPPSTAATIEPATISVAASGIATDISNNTGSINSTAMQGFGDEARFVAVSGSSATMAETLASEPQAVSLADTSTTVGTLSQHAAALSHELPLSPPLLLPQGTPDTAALLRDDVAYLILGPGPAGLLEDVADEACSLLPATLSGFAAAYLIMRQLAPRQSQIGAIRDALSASDRYWKLAISMSISSSARFKSNSSSTTTTRTSSSAQRTDHAKADNSKGTTPDKAYGQQAGIASSEDSARQVSDAFRTVAGMWLMMRRRVCQCAYMLIALHCLFASLLWQQTGDLAAPAACALVCAVTELYLLQWEGERTSSNTV